MSFRIRPGQPGDLDALYEMAKLTGGGFTNLPADRSSLEAKLARSVDTLAVEGEPAAGGLIVLVLENAATGAVRGTSQIFTHVGREVPFYSYRIGTLSQHSRELGRTFSAETLTLCTDLEGSSEVGGLFLHPNERAGGLGMLLARSRYLFIRQHRARFADRVLAELRGIIDEAGGSPFWDGVAGKFFGMPFQEADAFNAVHGHQFIADLMPKHPVYTAMLPEGARAAIGLPHPIGRAAMRMLEGEGFGHDRYIDIFDGGPTMVAQTDRVTSIAGAQDGRVVDIEPQVEGERRLVAAGAGEEFIAAYARISTGADGALTIDKEGADLLNIRTGANVLHVPRR